MRISKASMRVLLVVAVLCSCVLWERAQGQEGLSLLKLTEVSAQQAEAIAMAKFPGYEVTEIDIERDEKPLAWSVTVENAKKELDLDIDAKTGQILYIDKNSKKY